MAGQGCFAEQVGVVEHEGTLDTNLEWPALVLEVPGVEPAGPDAPVVDAAMAREVAGRAGHRWSAKYDGAPTTAIWMSGPIRTAIISFSTMSPKRIPASMRSATMSVRLSSMIISTRISGCDARKRGSTGITTVETACLVAVRRTVPDGFPRKAPSASTPEAMSSSAGRRRAKHRLARFGRRHRARGPRQEPHPEPLLQSLHGVAQRRLGHAELGRRTGKAALLRDNREGGEVVQIVSFHSCTVYISPKWIIAANR